MGRNYSQPTIKVLFAEARACAYPDCDEPLVLRDRGAVTPVADIAHIRSESPGGPRHDPRFTGDLNGPENLLLLCPKHHRPVDRHEQLYSIEELLEWKQAQQADAGAGTTITDADVRFYSRLSDEERGALAQVARIAQRLIDRCAQIQRELDPIVLQYQAAHQKAYESAGPMYEVDADGNQHRIPPNSFQLSKQEQQQWQARYNHVIESRIESVREAHGLLAEEVAVLRMTTPGLGGWLDRLIQSAHGLTQSVGSGDTQQAQHELEASVAELWRAANGEAL